MNKPLDFRFLFNYLSSFPDDHSIKDILDTIWRIFTFVLYFFGLPLKSKLKVFKVMLDEGKKLKKKNLLIN